MELPPASQPPPAPFEGQPLTARQRRILDVLREQDVSLGKSPKLADMYLGALITLAQSGNPDRLPQVAHSLRELMEKASRYWGVTSVKLSLPNKVRELAAAWQEAHVEGKDPAGGQPCQELKERLHQFFSWYLRNPSEKKQEYAELLSRLDPTDLPLPEDIAALRAERWRAVNKFFEQVAHHRLCAMEAFEERVAELEELLLDLLRPATREDQERIRRIVKEAEGHD